MAFDFGKYVKNYNMNNDCGNNNNDPDDEMNPLLKLHTECMYYDVDDMDKFVEPGNGFTLTCIHMNIHSLPSKYDQLRCLISNLKDVGIVIHCIMLCETFLTDINSNMFPLPGYQLYYNNRKHGRGGGVALYIRNEFQARLRSDLIINHDKQFESILAEITLNDKKIMVGEIYRVPGK